MSKSNHAGDQAWFQILAVVVTLAISIAGGVFTGLIVKLRVFQYTGKLKVYLF